jgi:hypothetical protein
VLRRPPGPGHGSALKGCGRAALVFLLFLLLSGLFHYRAFTEAILIAPDNDAIRYNYPIRHLYAYALKTLQLPLWNPYVFAGHPLLAVMQNGALYPLNVLFYGVLPAPYAYNLNYILHLALAGFFTYLYLRLIGIGGLPAFAAGMVFGFSGFLVANKDHTAMVNSAVYLPLLMYFLERLRRGAGAGPALMLALAVAVQLFAGNMQVCVYSYMVAGLFVTFYSVRKALGAEEGGALRFMLVCAAGMLLGLLIASPQLAATMELSGQSWLQNTKIYRGYVYFSLYHVYLATLPSIIFPHLFGGWGPVDGTRILIGVLPVVLAVASVMALARRSHYAIFWTLVAAVGLLLALGSDTPLGRAMYGVPVYNVFRAHGRNLLEFTLAVSVLFAMGLQSIFHEDEHRGACLRVALFVLSAGFLASLAAVGLAPYLPLEGVIEYLGSKGFQKPHLITRALSLKNPAVYSALAAMAVYLAWTALSLWFRGRALRYLVFAVMALEIFHISGFRNINGPGFSGAADLCGRAPYGELLRSDPGLYRVANMFRMNSKIRSNPSSNLFCRVGSVSAYDPLVMDDYAMLLDLWRDGTYTHMWGDLVRNNLILGMLGVKYLLVSADAGFNVPRMKTSGEGTLRERIPVAGFRVYGAEEVGGGRYRLGSRGEALSGVLSLKAGIYSISLRARSGEGAGGRLIVNVLPASSESRQEVLHVMPDRIGEEFSEFHRVFAVKRPEAYMLGVYSYSNTPVEVEDISLQRLNNYYPFPLAGGVPRGAEYSVYERLSDDGRFGLYLNRNHLPRAWSVGELVEADGLEDVKNRLYTFQVDPAHQAMLGGDDIRRIGERKFREGDVSVKEYGLNKVVLGTVFPGEGFLVLAEQYYPGWKAYVDGSRTEIYETNALLRGVVVPGGRHTVEFRYRPYGLLSLLALSLLTVSGVAAYLVMGRGGPVRDAGGLGEPSAEGEGPKGRA